MPLAKTAKIWKFFRVITDDGVIKRQCLKCHNLLPVPKDGSTSHLINHLKSKGHEEQFQEYGLDTLCKVPPISSFFSRGIGREKNSNGCANSMELNLLDALWLFENKNALLKVEELFMDANTSRKPQDVSQSNWTKIKRLESSLQPLDKEDFIVVKELCKVLKAFHVETCRLSSEQSTATTYLPIVTRMMKHLQSMPMRNLVVSNVKTSLLEGSTSKLSDSNE